MADTGWKIAGTGASINIAGTGAIWKYPQRITDTTTPATEAQGTSQNLVATNFGFLIPPAMSITGVEARIRRTTVRNSESVSDLEVRMIYSGSLRGDNKAKPDIWLNPDGGNYQNIDYGGASDVWGDALTPAIVNDPTFGCSLRTQDLDQYNKGVAYIQTIWMRIHYEEPEKTYVAHNGLLIPAKPHVADGGLFKPAKRHVYNGGWRS